jgi:hypothetical protein
VRQGRDKRWGPATCETFCIGKMVLGGKTMPAYELIHMLSLFKLPVSSRKHIALASHPDV